MAESDGDWGSLVEHDSDMAEVWDRFVRLPDPGQHVVLDDFVASKHIDIPALVRIGAKLTESGGTVLAFAFDGGIKYRDIVTGNRWSYLGSDFRSLKIIRAPEEAARAIVSEGETDGARLTMLYPNLDVAIMPKGAKNIPARTLEQLSAYEIVYVALDDDEAGHDGAARITEMLPNSMRVIPPSADWCAYEGDGAPELPEELERPAEMKVLVPAGELFELEYPEIASWFEHALLPIAGSLILHGWVKGFKSFMALDLMSALAQGQDWAGFEPTEEPCRVAVVQFEIPPVFYRDRVQLLRKHAREPQLFDENFLTWTPLQRPRLRAGNKAEEDFLLSNLLANNVQCVLVDPVRRAMGTLDMNAEADVRKLLAFYERMQDEGITVVTVHHDNKESARARGGDPVGMTGSGAWSGDFDTVVSVSTPKGMTIKDPKRNLTFLMRNAPSTGDRGMLIDEDGHILYSPTPFGDWDEEDEAPVDLPPI